LIRAEGEGGFDTGPALCGAPSLSLIGGYVPSLLDPALTILIAGSRVGTFASVAQPASMPAGLRFDVIYNPTNVQLVVAAEELIDPVVAAAADFATYGSACGLHVHPAAKNFVEKPTEIKLPGIIGSKNALATERLRERPRSIICSTSNRLAPGQYQ